MSALEHLTPEEVQTMIEKACARTGYRILAPGELDPVTLDKAEKVINGLWLDTFEKAAARRALKQEE